MAFLLFLFAFCVALFLFHWSTRKYINPYKLIMIFGKKGCGKSTTIAKLVQQHHKDGWICFSTIKCPNSYYIDPSIIGNYWFPENSVVFIDEVGMIWDNRDFKNFRPEVRDWFKYQRHNKVKVYLFSQTFDIDKKLRDLTDAMYLLVNKFRVFSYGKKISKIIVLTKSQAEQPGSISEDLQFEPGILFFLGTRTLTFIPKYAKLFDSHSRLDIPDLIGSGVNDDLDNDFIEIIEE